MTSQRSGIHDAYPLAGYSATSEDYVKNTTTIARQQLQFQMSMHIIARADEAANDDRTAFRNWVIR